jgi:epoxyqueuosine reductase
MSLGVTLKHTALIKEYAQKLGFEHCGISKAGFLETEAPRLEQWLQQGYHGKMAYMEHHFDKRLNPQLLVEGAKSVVSLIYNYYPSVNLGQEDTEGEGNTYKISKYAYGKDYHTVIKEKLKQLLAYIQTEIGEVSGRAFVDSAPVLDKAWAKQGGIGWIGKHSNLINRKMGSFFFIAELIIDLDLVYDTPIGDYCGTCTRCIDACPTEAITNPYTVDGSKCISYLTIELKENIPTAWKGAWNDWIFGCDICQDVCPWNRFASPHQTPEFEPSEALKSMRKQDWEDISEEVFKPLFKGSAVERTKFAGLRRNIDFMKG